jgi:hypothetical protein
LTAKDIAINSVHVKSSVPTVWQPAKPLQPTLLHLPGVGLTPSEPVSNAAVSQHVRPSSHRLQAMPAFRTANTRKTATAHLTHTCANSTAHLTLLTS